MRNRFSARSAAGVSAHQRHPAALEKNGQAHFSANEAFEVSKKKKFGIVSLSRRSTEQQSARVCVYVFFSPFYF